MQNDYKPVSRGMVMQLKRNRTGCRSASELH